MLRFTGIRHDPQVDVLHRPMYCSSEQGQVGVEVGFLRSGWVPYPPYGLYDFLGPLFVKQEFIDGTAKSNNSIATINKITLFLFKINPAIPHRNKKIVNVMIICIIFI